MSETEHHKGTLRLIKRFDTVEEMAKKLLADKGIEKEDYHDDYLDCLNDECQESIVLIDGEFYEIDDREIDTGDNIFEAIKNSDGTISYDVMYYNGGCGFGEAIEEAVEKLNKEVAK